MSHRVLVVDDFEPWRRHIRSALRNHPQWQIVGEAGDGLEAIEQAQALRPDLILLDVSLPTVDGIESAPRILAAHPHVKILFLSEHRSPDVVEAAFATKASGYLLKSEAGRELLSAMQTIMDGKQFVSAKLGAIGPAQPAKESIARPTPHHEAAFYTDEARLIEDYVRFAAEALAAGNALILVVTNARRDQIDQSLRARGFPIDRLIGEDRYIPIEVSDFLSAFMVDGRLDETQFLSAAMAVLAKAANGAGKHSRVVACGDGACTLWNRGSIDASTRVEQLWGEISRSHNVDVLCGYLMPDGEERSEDRQRLSATHVAIHSR